MPVAQFSGIGEDNCRLVAARIVAVESVAVMPASVMIVMMMCTMPSTVAVYVRMIAPAVTMIERAQLRADKNRR
jgi:hypothetical protein